MAPSGLVAVLAGWVTTEVGRQPFTVWGFMRTSESASPLDAPAVGASLMAFIIVYFFVFGAGVFYIIRLMRKTPARNDNDKTLLDGPIRTSGLTPAQQIRVKQTDNSEPSHD